MVDSKSVVLVDVVPEFQPKVDVTLLQRAVQTALDHAGRLSQPVEVSVRVTTDEEMQGLNRQYRDVDRPTDVLSFSFGEEESGPKIEMPPDMPVPLGEIALSYSYAERQATDLGHSVDKELAWLTIHGTLQLVGYTHYTDADAERMEALERAALHDLGFSSE